MHRVIINTTSSYRMSCECLWLDNVVKLLNFVVLHLMNECRFLLLVGILVVLCVLSINTTVGVDMCYFYNS